MPLRRLEKPAHPSILQPHGGCAYPLTLTRNYNADVDPRCARMTRDVDPRYAWMTLTDLEHIKTGLFRHSRVAGVHLSNTAKWIPAARG